MLNIGLKNGFSVAPVIPIGGGRTIEKPSLLEVISAFIGIKEIESDKLPILGTPALLQSHPLYNKLYNNITGKLPIINKKHCSGARVKANIASNGDVFPCVFLQYEEFKFGNLCNNNLKSVWNSDKANNFRHLLKSTTCSECSMNNLCTGGCLGVSYSYNKSLQCADPRCLLNDNNT